MNWSSAVTVLADHFVPASIENHVFVAVADLDRARTKATVFEPGEFEIDVFAHRRPDLY